MSASKPKNILFLMTDQHRADHVGCHPASRLALPNIDRLAEGTAFLNCVSVNPICTPARTALLTGKYTHQIGTLSMSGDLSLQHPTYPRALQKAGYYTAGIGKFHWLQGWPWGSPRGGGHDLVALEKELMDFGFDRVWEAAGKQLILQNRCHYGRHLETKGLLEEFRDHVASRGRNFSDALKTEFSGEPWPFEESDYVDIVTADRIVETIRDRPRDRPFFLFGSFCSPHAPFDPPQRFLDQVAYEEEDDFVCVDTPLPLEVKKRLYRQRRAYKAMLLCVDEQVGRIMDTLEQEGLLDETVILFTSDHGEMLGDRALVQKAQPWWQACTVPGLIRHPDFLSGQAVTGPVEITDFTATILDIAGVAPGVALSKPWPAFHDRVPCRSLMPVIRGEVPAVRDYAFSECSGVWQMIETERWKYVRWLERSDADAVVEAFYDKDADPESLRNEVGNPAHAEAIDGCRRQREFIMDTTPSAQLGWAPLMDADAGKGTGG